ncbi:hypothetical protein IW262DRAFT_1448538 [Armillaria fumosa]|nr:hypothetical protein IW262DRAFT_1448538 [Armillaria fumosa]
MDIYPVCLVTIFLDDELVSYDVDACPPVPSESPTHSVRIEDFPETEQEKWHTYLFPSLQQAGAPISSTPTCTLFHRIRDKQVLQGAEIWGPFADEDDWEMAKWLIKHVGQQVADDFLKLKMIVGKAQPSYKNKDQLLDRIDSLPARDLTNGEGQARTEELELWYRDPVECIWELMENPALRDSMKYTPEHVVLNQACEVDVINEMWTASWWWELQILPPDATICPIILSSDKTQLSQFCGDKSAWPIYLMIGNISKGIHREPSSHVTILVGYLPEAGRQGVAMTCSDEVQHWVWPIVAAYIADYPKQCLVASCKENHCPLCQVGHDEHGNNTPYPPRNVKTTLDMIQTQLSGQSDNETDWEDSGIREIPNLHKGVFKDHLVKWCTALIGEKEIDERFKAMPGYPELQHFKNGLSNVLQWTGAEYKAMEKVFLAVMAETKVDKCVVIAMRSTLDFIYFTSLQSHTSLTLASLSHALNKLHHVKDIFLETGTHEHFNIPKFHAMQHYVALICRFGSANGFNTESPERLHIDYAKDTYRASNRWDYTIQMTRWLSQQEAVDRFTSYIDWWKAGLYSSNGAIYIPCESLDISPSTMSTPTSQSAFHVSLCHPMDLCAVWASTIHTYLQQHGSIMFDLYRHLTVELPRIAEAGAKNLKNVIRVFPPVKERGRRKSQPAQLDFALVCTGERNERTRGTVLEGLHVVHVHVLFALPSVFNIATSAPLAYVEWFTPFASLDPITGMYPISRSTRRGHVYREVIEVHRIPRFGRIKDPGWTTENVKDMCSKFYFSPYIDLHMFCMLKANNKDCI